MNGLLTVLDEDKMTLLLMFDLSAAFDTIYHHILLSRLEICFGHRNEFASLSLLEGASIFRNGRAWNQSDWQKASYLHRIALKISRFQPAISLQETTYSRKKLVQVKENVLK